MPIKGIMASQISGHLYDGPFGAYDSLATVTLSATASSIIFAGIPSGYKHLQIRGLYRDTQAASTTKNLVIQFNSDTASNYAWHRIEGNGTTATASGTATTTSGLVSYAGVADTATVSVYGASIIDILDYANSSKYKTVRSLAGVDINGTGGMGFSSSLWQSTSAVTLIELKPGSTAFKTGTTFALYGVK